jgi:hypothetical protein
LDKHAFDVGIMLDNCNQRFGIRRMLLDIFRGCGVVDTGEKRHIEYY